MPKKLLLLLIICFALSNNLQAQKFNPSKIRFGLKADLNLSSFTDDVSVFDKTSKGYSTSGYSDYEKYFRITGMAGITADYAITPLFSVAAELIYNGRGAAYRVSDGDVLVFDNRGQSSNGYDYYKFKLDYIELPLLAQYSLSREGASTSYLLYGGIAPEVLVNSGTSYVYYVIGSSPTAVTTTSRDGSLDIASKFNLSPIVGLQIGDTREKKTQFYFDLRFECTLLPVFNSERISGYNFRTNMWTGGFGLGLRF